MSDDDCPAGCDYGRIGSMAPNQMTLTVCYSRVVDGGLIGGERKAGRVVFDRLDSIAAAEAVLADRRRYGWTITSAVLMRGADVMATLKTTTNGDRMVADR